MDEGPTGTVEPGATPLGLLVAGLLLVVLDFRFDGFDLLPDAVGWVVMLIGLSPLVSRDPWFVVVCAAAATGLLLAIPQQVAEPGPVLSVFQIVAETVVVFGTCSGIRSVIGEEAVRRTADRIRWIDLALASAGAVFGAVVSARGGDAVQGGTIVVLVLLAVATLAVGVWFLVFVWGVRRHPPLGRTAAPRARVTP